jgi:hypothetical protein
MDRNGFRRGTCAIVAVFVALALSLAAGAQSSWSNYYAGASEEAFSNVLPMADGGYLACGWTLSSGAGGYDGWLVRTGPAGDVIWQRAYGGPQGESISEVILLEDGGFLAVGYTSSYGAGDDDAWVLRLTSTGSIVWQKTFGGPDEDWAGRAESAGDGGFILAGYRTVADPGLEDVWVFKIDADGHMLWQKTFGGDSHEWANDILAVPGGFLVAVKSYIYQVYDVGWLIKLDGSGNALWQRRYEGPGGQICYPHGLTAFPGGGTFVWGLIYDGSMGQNAWLARLDDSGDFYWQKTYGTPNTDNMIWAVGMPEGGVVVAGYNYPTEDSSNAEGWVARLDGSGNLLWQYNGGLAHWDMLSGVSVTNDGGLMLAGRLGIGGPNHGWLLKTASDGSMDPSCTFGATSNAVIQGSSTTVSNVSLASLASTGVEGNASGTAFSSTAMRTFMCASSGACTVDCAVSAPASASAGALAAFSATAALQNCTALATFAWEFGDGGTSSVPNPTHAYAASGQYTWHLTATSDGVTCTKSGAITVLNPPVITLMKKVAPPFKIAVTGANLQNGVRVFIDGVEWSGVVWKKAEKVQLVGGASLKAVVPKGVSKIFRFVNPDGGEASVSWSW